MARVSAKRIKPTAQKPKTPATKPKETKSEGPTRGYQRMPPEMRLWIWRSVPMTHGVHFFKWDLGVVQDPAAPSYFNVPMQEVEVLLSPSCKSSWRSRNKMRRIDKYAWDVLKTELRRPSTKLMWPTPPLTKNPSIKRPGVFVNAEDDIVCFRPTRSPGPTWEMRPIDTRQFAGLKRVALMYNCPFPIMYRSVDVRDSEIIAEFLAFFPDVEKFYLITELNRDVGLERSLFVIFLMCVCILTNSYFHTGTAKLRNLEVFEDDGRKYFEIPLDDVDFKGPAVEAVSNFFLTLGPRLQQKRTRSPWLDGTKQVEYKFLVRF